MKKVDLSADLTPCMILKNTLGVNQKGYLTDNVSRAKIT